MENTTPPTDERPLVLLGQPLFPEFAAALAGRFRFVLVADADAATLAEGRALLIGLKPVTDDHLAALPALGLVAGISVGINHVDLAACRRRGIAVTNAGAAFAVDTADYGVGLVVAVLRRLAAAEAHVRAGRWAAVGDYPLTTKVGTDIQLSSSWPPLRWTTLFFSSTCSSPSLGSLPTEPTTD